MIKYISLFSVMDTLSSVMSLIKKKKKKLTKKPL